jgi:hypothetical protein
MHNFSGLCTLVRPCGSFYRLRCRKEAAEFGRH